MILVDTSIWIDHIRAPDEQLAALLAGQVVLMHPFIIGEVALGSIANRQTIVELMRSFGEVIVGRPEDVMVFIEHHRLHGTGISYVDAHLLVSAKLTPETAFWTRDKRLLAVAERLSLAAKLAH